MTSKGMYSIVVGGSWNKVLYSSIVQYIGNQMKVKRQQAEAAYMMTCTILLDSMVN
jgi:hypothetical protein